ncbi:putative RNA ligase [Klebsiella phage DP]|nr:putative RNA ligase [Klebsiella phage DP]
MKFNVDDLVAKKLVTKKTYTEGPFAGLSVLKYKNNVFWDNLWHTDQRLLECRGMVVDSEDNVIIWPFTKIFNRFENGKDLPMDKQICVPRKVNGFMAAAGAYNGDWIVSTTGTLDSDFAHMAKEKIDFYQNWTLDCRDMKQLTLIFEICDDSDPHIVHEHPGAYLIGARNLVTGKMLSEKQLDGLASGTNWKRPEWDICSFGDVVIASQAVNHEGFVVRDVDTGELLLKIKSPHYLTKKFLMRGGDNKWDMIWDNPQNAKQRIDEEYYDLLDHIREYYSKDVWAAMDSQKRRQVVEDYFTIEDMFDRDSRFYVGVPK